MKSHDYNQSSETQQVHPPGPPSKPDGLEPHNPIRQGSKTIWIIGIVAVVIMAIAGLLLALFFFIFGEQGRITEEEANKTLANSQGYGDYIMHTSNKYGFSFLYPEEFTVTDTGSGVIVQRNTHDVFSIRAINGTQTYPTGLQWFLETASTSVPDRRKVREPEISGLTGTAFTTDALERGCGMTIAVAKHGVVYHISKLAGTCDISEDVFDELRKSFSFLSMDAVELKECGRPSEFVEQYWFDAMSKAASRIAANPGAATEMCVDATAEIVLYVVPDVSGGGPQVFRYLIQDDALEKASVVSHGRSWLVGARDLPRMQGNFGRIRTDETLDTDGCETSMTYEYDLYFNVVELVKERRVCLGDGINNPEKKSENIEYR